MAGSKFQVTITKAPKLNKITQGICIKCIEIIKAPEVKNYLNEDRFIRFKLKTVSER